MRCDMPSFYTSFYTSFALQRLTYHLRSNDPDFFPMNCLELQSQLAVVFDSASVVAHSYV